MRIQLFDIKKAPAETTRAPEEGIVKPNQYEKRKFFCFSVSITRESIFTPIEM